MDAASRLLFAQERSLLLASVSGPLVPSAVPSRDGLLCSRATPTGQGEAMPPRAAAALRCLAGTLGERAPQSSCVGRLTACFALPLRAVPPPSTVHRGGPAWPCRPVSRQPGGASETALEGTPGQARPWGFAAGTSPFRVALRVQHPHCWGVATTATSASGEDFRPSAAPATAPRGERLADAGAARPSGAPAPGAFREDGGRGDNGFVSNLFSVLQERKGEGRALGAVSANGDSGVAPAAGPADLSQRWLRGSGPHPGAHGWRPRDLTVPGP